MSFLAELVSEGIRDANKGEILDFAMEIGSSLHNISLGKSGYFQVVKSLMKGSSLSGDNYIASVLNSSEITEVNKLASRITETVVGTGGFTPQVALSRVIYSIVRDYDSSIPALAHKLKHTFDPLEREKIIFELLVDLTSGDQLSPGEWDAAEIALTEHFKLPVSVVSKLKAMLIAKWEGVSTAYTM